MWLGISNVMKDNFFVNVSYVQGEGKYFRGAHALFNTSAIKYVQMLAQNHIIIRPIWTCSLVLCPIEICLISDLLINLFFPWKKMIPALPASITLFALSFVTFSSLLFFVMMHMRPPLHGLKRAEFSASRYNSRVRNGHSSSPEEDEEEADCTVCLCRLQDGEEIKELGCDHVFHMACFNRWASHCRYTTCPVCRRLIASAEFTLDNDGVKVLTFRLWDFGNGDDQSNWWLRWRGSSLIGANLAIESVVARLGGDEMNEREGSRGWFQRRKCLSGNKVVRVKRIVLDVCEWILGISMISIVSSHHI